MKTLLYIFLIGGLLLSIGCSDNEDVKTKSISIKNIEEDGITLEATDQFQIEVEVNPSDITLGGLTYKSSDESVFTVSAKGVITAKQVGEAQLTVKTQDGTYIRQIRDVKVVTKVIKVDAIAIEGLENNTLIVSFGVIQKIGYKLTPEITAEDVIHEDIEFESDDTSIFTVDASGNVTGVNAGVANLTIRSKSNPSVEAQCKVDVRIIPITGLKLPATLSIKYGVDFDFKQVATITPTTASKQELAYSLSDAGIISISDAGIITPLKPGTVTITASTTDGSDLSTTCQLTLLPEFDNTGWGVTCSSEQVSDGGGKMTILNTDSHSTYWHNDYTSSNQSFPHWLIIDMKSEKEIAKVLIGRKQRGDGTTNTDTKLVQVYISNNNIDFTKVGDIDFGDTSHGDLDKALSFTPTKARYVKLIVTESNRYPYANIAVFKVYPKE